MTELRTVWVRATSPPAISPVTVVDNSWIREIGVVEDVEEFGTEFEFHFFGNGCGFRKCQVKIDIARPAQEVAGQRSVCGERWIGDHLGIGGQNSGSRHAAGHGIIFIAALRVAQAIGVEIVLAGVAGEGLGDARVQLVQRSDYVGVSVEGIPCAGGTFGIVGVFLAQVGEDVIGQASSPSDDWEQAPTLGKTLGRRAGEAVKGQVPSAAEGDAIANVLIAGGAE